MNQTQDIRQQVSREVELTGHFLDSLTLSRVLDTVEQHGGDFRINKIEIGHSKRDFSYARLTILAPDKQALETIIEAIRPHIAKTPVNPDASGQHAGVRVSPAGGVKPQEHPPSPLGNRDVPKILMCPPDYFTVEYAINPWMKEAGPCDTEKAKKQWEALYNAISKEAGAEVHLMKPVPGLPDLVFTANAAFVHGDKAIIAHYKHEERQGEEPHCEQWFREHGYQTFTMPRGIYFEGAGDALLWQDRVFAGYKTRTDLASHSFITAETGLPVLSLELINQRFYHIDVCICPLYDGHFIYYPEAFDEYGRSVIQANVPADKLIPVTAEEAAKFACNTVNINDTVIFNQGSNRLAEELKQRGFNVIQLDLSEFLKSGGSSKCLTLRIG